MALRIQETSSPYASRARRTRALGNGAIGGGIAGWGEKGALEAICEYAETIDKIARRIEEALAPDGQPVEAPVMAGN